MIREIYIFQKGIDAKVNVIKLVKFKLAYFAVAVHQFSH